MSEVNKTYRIRTQVGSEASDGYISLDANLVQDYEAFDILSVKISSSDTYRLHNANYGVVVGRVIANNGFGVPNAKLSIFIESDSSDGEKVKELYPFIASYSKDWNGVRYNLLPDEEVGDCHQIVGTFPNKRYLLDNDVVLEVFDKYYTFTTRTNNSGDYLIMGVPVGTHTLHMDLDLSDCGILSQRPRDFVYKGYTVEQFENPNKFKSGTDYANLSQVFTQDRVVNVQPFWGNESLGETIGLTRADINISFEFQPTCVFIGSVVSDKSSDGITKKCMATENMGNMEEMTTGEGTIEMIRKTPNGSIEEFQVKGTQLIDSNGVWCYQIPMNLDYMMTDEYGNMVPTDDPLKGIPTRCSARFRISMQDNEENVDNFFRAKVLVPHNPQNLPGGEHEEYDYEFGSKTRDDSFRDLFWNNVYTVKSYIPRFQKRKTRGWRDKRFTGIKSCNFSGTNNPIPYNNIRIKLPLMFTILCAIIKCFIYLTGVFNTIINRIGLFLAKLGGIKIFDWRPFGVAWEAALDLKLNVLSEGLCPDLENWFFAPVMGRKLKTHKQYNLLRQTITYLTSDNGFEDEKSIEYENGEAEDNVLCLTINTDYLISCVEMNLAMEYKVINFDFYNDWINGLIYIPRFMRYLRPKKTFLGITFAKAKIKGCMDDTKIFSKTRRYTQQCALGYKPANVDNNILYSNVENPLRRNKNKIAIKRANNLHKSRGFSQKTIFGKNGGICHEHTTSKKQNVYYMKPCEWTLNTNPANIKVNLFATDIVLLGSLNDCDSNGVPQAFKYLSSTSYIIPTNLALTNMETNATLYANEKGSICTGSGGQLPTDETLSDNDGVRVIPVSSGLSGEILYYSGAQDTNIDVAYEGKELSDIIALTEAAGISWDYTGPGQGEPDPKRLYYPGGHFLGLTCVNSQTNLKSCINLERICEVGANMSQRKEDVRGVDVSGVTSYIYYPPTGFISGDDIVAEDFRIMFSTLNQNRLIATKINPLTGYRMYDFKYIHPINFDGSFANVVKNNNNYNVQNSGIVPTESYTVLRNAGIETNMNNRPDGDVDEHTYTLTRTIESTSVDYYRFRFGLNKNNNGELDNNLQKRKFLLFKDNKYYLPQYENSFYFYFGMKPGASAMDEFNKQFFAQCETNSITMIEPGFELRIGNMNVCEGEAVVTISINGMETPYSKIFYTKEGVMELAEGGETQGDITDDVYKLKVTEIVGDYRYIKSIDVPELSFGNYTFTVIDANGLTINKNINIGGDILSAEIIKHDFNVSDYNSLKGKERDVFGGGYFEIKNFEIREYKDIISNRNTRVVIKSGDYETSAATSDSLNIYVPSANVIYDIYLSYKCSGNSVWNDIYYASYTLQDGSSVLLNMGPRNLPAYLPVGPSGSTNSLIYGENEWWKKIDTEEDKMNEDWLKKLCLFKENTTEETFSNNVFAINGSKVLWGTPQNENGVYIPVDGKNVFSSEDDSELYNNNTLDDDYSYFPTIPSCSGNVNYSAIAVNGTTVAGDYWAILNDSQTGWVSSQRFTSGTGYVFKPLPNGELQYHVYSDKLIYNPYILEDGTSLLDEPEENVGYEKITKGIFYPSFIYPVISAPFKADFNFYVWEEKYVYIEEGSDIPKYGVSQNAGRTEVEITNGITYNGNFSNAYIQNIKDTDLSAAIKNAISVAPDTAIITGGTRTIVLSGMSVDVSVLEETDDEDSENIKPIFKDAYIANGNFLFAKGFSGITDFRYEITEGVPKELNFNGKVLSGSLINQVNSIADDIDAEMGFSKSISYKIISESSIGGVKEYYVNFNGNDKTKYYIQKDKANNKLLYSPDTGNNLSYIYYKRGDKEPTYDILAMYNENAEYNKKNELCFIRVNYPKKNKMTYSIPYINESGDIVYQSGEVKSKSAKNNRNNISWFIDQIGNNKKATPVQNNLIVMTGYSTNTVYSGNWADKLSGGTDNKDIQSIEKEDGTYKFSIDSGDILFAVQQKSATTVNGGITNVFKIFPVVLPQAKDDNEDEIYVYSAGTVHLGEEENDLTEMTKITLTSDNSSSNVFSATYYSTVISGENSDETEKVKCTMLTVNNNDYELSGYTGSSITFDNDKYKLHVKSKSIKYFSAAIEEDNTTVYESAITYGLQFEALNEIDENKSYNLTFWSKDDKNTGVSLILELLREFTFTLTWVNGSSRTISKGEGISLSLYNNATGNVTDLYATFVLDQDLSLGDEYSKKYTILKTELENVNYYMLNNLDNIDAKIYYGGNDTEEADENIEINGINTSSGNISIYDKNVFFGITEDGGSLRIKLIDR